MAMKQELQLPVLQVTRYDWVSSWLIAIVLALLFAVGGLAVVWAAVRPSERKEPVPVEIVEIPGGDEQGVLEETLRLESPAEASSDPSLAEIEAPESEIEETLENVVDVAAAATNLADKQFELETRNAGKPGSATGTGRRALGMGGGEAGIPREQRWFISYADQQSLEAYARQLDHFGIELGALTRDGRIIYLSRLSDPQPQVRTVDRGSGETRLYMIWQGGGRRRADLQLFQKAGIEIGDAVILQFYPRETEDQLARLERSYRDRPAEQIRRTYFSVRATENGYEYAVTRQTFFE